MVLQASHTFALLNFYIDLHNTPYAGEYNSQTPFIKYLIKSSAVRMEISGNDENIISLPLVTHKSWEQIIGKEKD
jgi:hypothetical protein